MAILNIGTLIRTRREELGITQEDLADGICAVPTLSRIENGERMPTKNHLEALMERLGYSAAMADCYADEQTLQIQQLRYKIQFSYMGLDYEQCREYLRQMEALVDKRNRLDRQFVLYHRVVLYQKDMSLSDKLAKLEEVLLLSCPSYKTKGLPKVLSHVEINLLNSIATAYGAMCQWEEAIAIFEHIRAYYDRHVVIPEETLRTQSMILYNHSKALGLSARYDECIEVCDQGIRIARQTGRCQHLAKTLYNRGWALLRRNRATDRVQAELSLRQACYQAYVMEQKHDFAAMKKYYEKEFGPLDSSVNFVPF